MFLRLATSWILSFLKAVSHLLHFRFSQHSFWGFIVSWMRVSVDVSGHRYTFKVERNKRINVQYKMKVSLFYLTTPTCNFPLILHPANGWWLSGRCLYEEWADRKWQLQLSHNITTPKQSMESSISENSLPLSLSLTCGPRMQISPVCLTAKLIRVSGCTTFISVLGIGPPTDSNLTDPLTIWAIAGEVSVIPKPTAECKILLYVLS